MIERIVFYLIGGTVALAVLASMLPKIIPSAIVVFTLVVVARVVFWYTR
jgi:hypothetical protein